MIGSGLRGVGGLGLSLWLLLVLVVGLKQTVLWFLRLMILSVYGVDNRVGELDVFDLGDDFKRWLFFYSLIRFLVCFSNIKLVMIS